MSTQPNPESQESIVPLPEQAEVAELQQNPVTQAVGEIATSAAYADAKADGVDITSDDTDKELPLSSEIPSLLPQLERITSAHEHRYSDENSVYTKLKVVEKTPEDKRTPEQQQVIKDTTAIKKFAPYASVYEEVYTPQELNGLVTVLNTLSGKNRPDFDGVEGQVLDVVLGAIHTTDLVPASVQGIAKRAEQNAGTRKGMQWDTLTKLATVGSKVIRKNMRSGNEDYLIDVKDPEPKKYPDLSEVYQFVADAHALEIAGRRVAQVAQARKDAFVGNCEVVNAWYAEVAPVLARLPQDFKVGRFGAAYEIERMVTSMDKRLTGKESSGIHKDYRLDPAGAISLQKRIGHTIEAIKDKLRKSEGDESEIVPLEA